MSAKAREKARRNGLKNKPDGVLTRLSRWIRRRGKR